MSILWIEGSSKARSQEFATKRSFNCAPRHRYAQEDIFNNERFPCERRDRYNRCI